MSIHSRFVGKKSYFHKINFQESRMKLNVAFSLSLVKFSLLEILNSFILLVAIRRSSKTQTIYSWVGADRIKLKLINKSFSLFLINIYSLSFTTSIHSN